jgi:DNA-binding NarL/FixJ family response regulator
MNTAPVILLVEPSPVFRLRLTAWLGNVLPDARILTATNGLEALNLAVQEQPTHLLIEMDLPDANSAEIVWQMRQRLPAAKIVVTGWYDSRLVLEIIESAGADGFILANKLHRDLLHSWEVPLA